MHTLTAYDLPTYMPVLHSCVPSKPRLTVTAAPLPPLPSPPPQTSPTDARMPRTHTAHKSTMPRARGIITPPLPAAAACCPPAGSPGLPL